MKVKVRNRIQELSTKSQRIEHILVKLWKVGLRMNDEKNGKQITNETSAGSKLDDKINQYNLQYNLDNMVLHDYEVYHTLLALISLAILSYQQVIGNYETKKKFEIDIRDQSPEAAAESIETPLKKS